MCIIPIFLFALPCLLVIDIAADKNTEFLCSTNELPCATLDFEFFHVGNCNGHPLNITIASSLYLIIQLLQPVCFRTVFRFAFQVVVLKRQE